MLKPMAKREKSLREINFGYWYEQHSIFQMFYDIDNVINLNGLFPGSCLMIRGAIGLPSLVKVVPKLVVLINPN